MVGLDVSFDKQLREFTVESLIKLNIDPKVDFAVEIDNSNGVLINKLER